MRNAIKSGLVMAFSVSIFVAGNVYGACNPLKPSTCIPNKFKQSGADRIREITPPLHGSPYVVDTIKRTGSDYICIQPKDVRGGRIRNPDERTELVDCWRDGGDRKIKLVRQPSSGTSVLQLLSGSCLWSGSGDGGFECTYSRWGTLDLRCSPEKLIYSQGSVKLKGRFKADVVWWKCV